MCTRDAQAPPAVGGGCRRSNVGAKVHPYCRVREEGPIKIGMGESQAAESANRGLDKVLSGIVGQRNGADAFGQKFERPLGESLTKTLPGAKHGVDRPGAGACEFRRRANPDSFDAARGDQALRGHPKRPTRLIAVFPRPSNLPLTLSRNLVTTRPIEPLYPRDTRG